MQLTRGCSPSTEDMRDTSYSDIFRQLQDRQRCAADGLDDYMFGILHSSGWVSIILGVLQLAVAAMAVTGDQLARWLGVALLTLNAINQRFFIGTYPFCPR